MAVATNLGTGGSVLDAQYGSTPAPNTNEPLLLGHTGTNYLYLPGVANNFASTPDAAALDITGDIDIRVRVAMDDWTPAALSVLAAKWNSSASGNSWYFAVNTAGTLTFVWSPDGTTIQSATSTVAPTVADGAELWLRVALDVDNGASGRTTTFFTSTDGATWSQLGTAVTTAGVTSILSGIAPVEVGSRGTGASNPAAAKFYRAIVRNGIGGTTVLDADFTSGITSGGQTTFTESSTNAATVTISRSAGGHKSCAVVRPVWLLGTDDFFEVADNALLDFGASDSFTVVAVVRQWHHFASRGPLVAKRATSYGLEAGWALHRDTALGVLVLGDGAIRPYASANLPSVGSLAFVAGVRSVASDDLTVTVGLTAGTPANDTTTVTLANALPTRIGANGAPDYADMELLAVAVFRRALTAAELATIAAYYGAS